MIKIITMTQKEWESLPIEISKILYQQSLKKDGFTIISKINKKVIKGNLLHFFYHQIEKAIDQIEKNNLNLEGKIK